MNRTLLPLIEAEFERYKLMGERAMRQLRPIWSRSSPIS